MMAVVNRCLKVLFIGINIIHIILAGVIFTLAIILGTNITNQFRGKGQDVGRGMIEAPIWLLGSGVLVVASLGIHGARKEKKWPLISFITANVIGLTIVLMLGAQFAKAKILFSQLLPHYAWSLNAGLAVSFSLAALWFTTIILAAMIMHQLHSRQPAMSDVEGEPPGYSQMCPMSSKSAESLTRRILPNYHTANDTERNTYD